MTILDHVSDSFIFIVPKINKRPNKNDNELYYVFLHNSMTLWVYERFRGYFLKGKLFNPDVPTKLFEETTSTWGLYHLTPSLSNIRTDKVTVTVALSDGM